MIYQSDKTTKLITIRCDCGNEIIELMRCDWGDETDYIINFYVSTFSAGQGIFNTLKCRLKMAWLALRKGSYIHEEIIANRKKLEELQVDLVELLKEPDIEHGYKTTTI